MTPDFTNGEELHFAGTLFWRPTGWVVVVDLMRVPERRAAHDDARAITVLYEGGTESLEITVGNAVSALLVKLAD